MSGSCPRFNTVLPALVPRCSVVEQFCLHDIIIITIAAGIRPTVRRRISAADLLGWRACERECRAGVCRVVSHQRGMADFAGGDSACKAVADFSLHQSA